MSSLVSSFSVWDWLQIIGTAMVLIGVGGELFLEIKKYPFNPTSFPPLESSKRKIEIVSLIVLLLGLLLEIIALPHSLSEVAGLNKQTAQLISSNLMLAATVETLKSNNVALAETAAKFAKIITQTQNELEETEEPMGFDKLEFSGGSLNPFNVALKKIPKTHIKLVNIADSQAEYTANKLAGAFQWSNWSLERGDEISKSCLGVYIGVYGWKKMNYFFLNDTNNPYAQSALALVKLLTENGFPVRIGPPVFDISLQTNSILMLVGQKPDPLTTKIEIFDVQGLLLNFEEKETMNRLGINQSATSSDATNRLGIKSYEWYGMNEVKPMVFYQSDQTNIDNVNRIHKVRQELQKQKINSYEEVWKRDLNRQKTEN